MGASISPGSYPADHIQKVWLFFAMRSDANGPKRSRRPSTLVSVVGSHCCRAGSL